jgi:hypothetical protein
MSDIAFVRRKRAMEQRAKDMERAAAAERTLERVRAGSAPQRPVMMAAPASVQMNIGKGRAAVGELMQGAIGAMKQEPWWTPAGATGRVAGAAGDLFYKDSLTDAQRAREGEEVYWEANPGTGSGIGLKMPILDLVGDAVDVGGVVGTGLKGVRKGTEAFVDALGRRMGPVGDVPVADAGAELQALAAALGRLPEGRMAMTPPLDGSNMFPPGEVPPARNAKVRKAAAAQRSPQQVRADARKAGVRPTVKNPTTVAYPRIYDRPDELVGRAQVAPESPALKRVFGVTRDDLFQLAEEGRRQGNITERPYKTAAKPKGAKHSELIQTPQNTQRVLDILEEARKRPELYKGMASWYTMDPLYQELVRLVGPENAAAEFNRLNTLTGMASPGSEVLTEINRGTAANWLSKEGRFDDFMKYGGAREDGRPLPGTPEDMMAVQGHPYHKTAQGMAMQKYLDTGEVQMGSAKVPSYIAASGVPETGFQTQYPVGDAHFSRIIGLPDVRPLRMNKGELQANSASASVPEMVGITPWWQTKIAAEAGIEPVPTQAVVWGAGANATGVTSPVGATKLELLAMQIEKAAARMGVPVEEARDLILTGKAHAGEVDPELLIALGFAGAAGAAGAAGVARYAADREQVKKD